MKALLTYRLYLQVVIDKSSCLNLNNQANYGEFVATNVAKLKASRVDAPESSGSEIIHPISVALIDFYGQVVPNDNELVVYSSTADSISGIQGSTIVKPVNGIAIFSNITLSLLPNSVVSVLFNLSISVEGASIPVKFRYKIHNLDGIFVMYVIAGTALLGR